MIPKQSPVLPSLPDCLIDHLIVGIAGRVECPQGFDYSMLDAAARSLGCATTPAHGDGRAGYNRFTFPLEREDGQRLGSVRIESYLHRTASGFSDTNRSCFVVNLQKLARADVGFMPRRGDHCFDGNDNVLPGEMQGAAGLARQMELLAELLPKVIVPLLNAYVEPYAYSLERVWVKTAEACYDVEVVDAIEATRILQHVAISGAIESNSRAYEHGTTDTRRIPLVYHRVTEHGPKLKTYAKRSSWLRHEVACHKRREVTALTGFVSAPGTSAGLVSLAAGFASAASPHLTRMRAHASEALEHERFPVDLIIGLEPLARVAAGRGKAGAETVAKARHALGQLLSRGFCDLTGDVPRHAHVAALRQIAAIGTVLTQQPGRLRFYLRPGFGRAVQQLSAPSRSSAGPILPILSDRTHASTL